MHRSGPTRRALLGLGVGAFVATVIPGVAGAIETVAAELRRLEERYGARIGVYARHTATDAVASYRADERFPLCSVWKPLAAAAILRDMDQDGEFLSKTVHYDESDLVEHSPVTGDAANLASGMTVERLCDATIRFSDNTAGNLLLRELGGPNAVTRFCRSIGDPVTRLDRWETRLNSAEPWRRTDTTTPRAIAGTFARLTLGGALSAPDRRRLGAWLRGNTTSDDRFRAGLPDGWALGDKTGAGEYGTNHDVGVVWPPDQEPIVLAAMSAMPEPEAERDDRLLADVARSLVTRLG